MHTYEYPRPALTVDTMLLSDQDSSIYILLIRRKNDPYKGMWAFPGGFVDYGENLLSAAKRELAEETGLNTDCIEQFRAYGDIDRDPRGWTVSVVHFGWLDDLETPTPADDAVEARWFSIDDLPEMAFDHWNIIMDFIEAQ